MRRRIPTGPNLRRRRRRRRITKPDPTEARITLDDVMRDLDPGWRAVDWPAARS